MDQVTRWGCKRSAGWGWWRSEETGPIGDTFVVHKASAEGAPPPAPAAPAAEVGAYLEEDGTLSDTDDEETFPELTDEATTEEAVARCKLYRERETKRQEWRQANMQQRQSKRRSTAQPSMVAGSIAK